MGSQQKIAWEEDGLVGPSKVAGKPREFLRRRR